ncbi:MAG: erythromycin esterase family protein, partial [Saprospiraceae bacterium]|nr:erythromycin esterase family protein [Saprospiraceae bacterium]
VKDQQIAIGGYDIQRSGRQFVRLLNEVLAESGIRALDVENQYASIRSLLSNRKVQYDSVSKPTLQLITQYESIANKLSSDAKQDDRISLTLRTIQNRVDYLRYMLQFAEDENWRLRWKARDEGMANNLKFISKTFYPEGTILVIGHNFHIARYNEHEEVMGELLSFHDPNTIYTLGVFAGGGTYATNSGEETAMMPPDEDMLDIKEVIKHLGGKVNFLPIGEFKESPENAWLFQPLVINDSFIDLIGSNKLTPSKHFDGLLLLDQVTAVKT